MRGWFVGICAGALLALGGCVHVVDVPGQDSQGQTRSQGLSAEECESRCMSEFHACKDRRPKGKGASECAHQKNACKKRC